MPASLSFDAAWRDLNHRSATLWLLLFGCIPGMFLLAYVLNDLLLQGAQLLLLQPHQGCERHGTTGGNRLLAVALVHRVNAQVVVRSAGSVAQCKIRMSSTLPSWSTARDRYWGRALILRKTSSRYHLSHGRELRERNRLA